MQGLPRGRRQARHLSLVDTLRRACLRLVSALVMETNQEWMERRYLNMQAGEPEPTAKPPALDESATRAA